MSPRPAAITQADVAHEKGFAEGIKAAANWLRRNANAEKDPKVRAAFIEAHNAVRKIERRHVA